MTFNQWVVCIIGALVLAAISPVLGALACVALGFCAARPDVIRKFLNSK